MKTENRIHYNSNELIQRIEASLDGLKPFQYDSKYRELLGSYLTDKIIDWDRNIRMRKNDPFTLVVCGDFKRGKSSIVNAILQDDVSPTNVTTETVTMNRISYGPHNNEAVFSGGRRLTLSDEELCRDSLENVMEQMSESIQRLELHRPIELLKQITLVDTPGLGDAERDFSEEVEEVLKQADAVIYVFSASFPLSRTEQLYLRASILPQKYTSLYLVANFSDVISNQEDYERVKEMLKARVNDLISGQEIFLVSALDERCRQMNAERPNEVMKQILEDNFRSFRKDLDDTIRNKSETVLPDRMQRMLRMMSADINDNLLALKQGLEMDAQAVKQAMQELNSGKETQSQVMEENTERIKKFINGMKGEACVWMENLIQKLKQDTETLDHYSVDDLMKYYSLFCVDTLQEALSRCLEWHTEDLMNELDKISEELTRDLSKKQRQAEYNFRFALNNRTWTKGDNVSFIGSRFGGGLLEIAASGIGGLMRKKELQNRKPQVIETIKQQYDSLNGSVQKEIIKTYNNLEKSSIQILREYYQGKLIVLEQQVEQASMVARQDDDKKGQVRQAIDSLSTVMSEISQPAL